MGNILVVAEQMEGKLRGVTLPTIGFAQELKKHTGGEVIVLVIGSGVDAVAQAAAKGGADKVVVADDPVFADYLAENWAPAVAEVAESVGATDICVPSSTSGKDFMPRVAARLEAGMVSDVIEVFEDDDEGVAFKRPIWSGNLFEKVAVDSDIRCFTVRTTAFEAPPAGEAPVEPISTSVSATESAEFVNFDKVESDRPELTEASVVISGGRGLKSAEAFGMLEDLADVLGAALGASRAAVDSGYAPNDWQIGQTGKIVAPELYFAVAISGAIQHLAGMKGSKVIVAINKDPEAPIFQVSDYGLVADAFEVVPQLTEKVKAIQE